jgi:hypothetical protein
MVWSFRALSIVDTVVAMMLLRCGIISADFLRNFTYSFASFLSCLLTLCRSPENLSSLIVFLTSCCFSLNGEEHLVGCVVSVSSWIYSYPSNESSELLTESKG